MKQRPRGPFSRPDSSSSFLIALPILGCLIFVVGNSIHAGEPQPGQRSSVRYAAASRTAASLFPGSTIVYAEVKPPRQIVEFLLKHPLRKRIEELPQVKTALKSPQYLAFLAGLGMVEFQTRMQWPEALDGLAGRGLAIGFDPAHDGVGAVLMSNEPGKMPDLVRDLLKLVATNDSKAVGEGEYRGLKAYAIQKKVYLVPLKDRLLVANKKEMAKNMVDLWLDADSQSLESGSTFQSCRSQQQGKTAWAFLDLATVRKSGMAGELFRGKTENIGVELIMGGLAELMKTADHLSAALELTEDRLNLTVRAPFDETKISPARQFFFGSDKDRQGFSRLRLKDALVDVTAYRDIGRLWLSKEDLFDENHLSELSQADSTLSTLFSGLDFGEDILGSAKGGFQILARNQDYSRSATPEPDIRVPEFAFVFRMNEDEKIRRRFRVAYQSFIGFLNIQLAQEGNPQLELESEKIGNARVVAATYLPEEGKEDQGLILYNFSPTIAFADEWFVISSTRQLATDLVTGGADRVDADPGLNTSIRVDGRQLQKILRQNSEQLIAQNMLEEGNDRQEAENQIGLLLDLIGLLKQAGLELKQTDGNLDLDLTVDIRSN